MWKEGGRWVYSVSMVRTHACTHSVWAFLLLLTGADILICTACYCLVTPMLLPDDPPATA